MTMYYTLTEEQYAAAAAYMREKSDGFDPPISQSISEPMTEIPDMNEAERIWKLLVAAAQN